MIMSNISSETSSSGNEGSTTSPLSSDYLSTTVSASSPSRSSDVTSSTTVSGSPWFTLNPEGSLTTSVYAALSLSSKSTPSSDTSHITDSETLSSLTNSHEPFTNTQMPHNISTTRTEETTAFTMTSSFYTSTISSVTSSSKDDENTTSSGSPSSLFTTTLASSHTTDSDVTSSSTANGSPLSIWSIYQYPDAREYKHTKCSGDHCLHNF
ncbi:mucin-3A-like [Tupaia chinensis]|uniref:mucin-3A-like n=1 Tax=Tupaia chinensis TaxID=246437 RepID=UPI000FFB4C6D|nr:mucin-3A-like [Tupaia chinensis]